MQSFLLMHKIYTISKQSYRASLIGVLCEGHTLAHGSKLQGIIVKEHICKNDNALLGKARCGAAERAARKQSKRI
jgi:hypothetical protein